LLNTAANASNFANDCSTTKEYVQHLAKAEALTAVYQEFCIKLHTEQF
jgi:hypothetical protein